MGTFTCMRCGVSISLDPNGPGVSHDCKSILGPGAYNLPNGPIRSGTPSIFSQMLDEVIGDTFAIDPLDVGRALTNPAVYRPVPCPVCQLVGFDCGGHETYSK